MKKELKEIYLPVNTSRNNNYSLCCWSDFEWSHIEDLERKEAITFTQEEYNVHIKNIIESTLKTAADNAETEIEENYAGSLGNENGLLYNKIQIIDKDSITNTLEETYLKYKI